MDPFERSIETGLDLEDLLDARQKDVDDAVDDPILTKVNSSRHNQTRGALSNRTFHRRLHLHVVLWPQVTPTMPRCVCSQLLKVIA